MDLNEFTNVKIDQKGILDKIERLRHSEFEDLENLFLNSLKIKKLPTKSNDKIIQQILPKNINDRKYLNKEFYIAQFICLKRIAFECFICDEFVEKISKLDPIVDKFYVFKYGLLIENYLFDSAYLFQELNINLYGKPIDNFRMHKNIFQPPDVIFRSIPLLLLGGIITEEPDYLNHADTIATIIRQALELRLRRGLGVIGLEDKSNNSRVPLGLSKILDVAKEFKEEIYLSVPFENIQRINGWANIYMHIGMKNYLWVVMFTTNYLQPLILGKKIGNSARENLNSGIQFTIETHEKFIESLKYTVRSNNSHMDIITTNPEAYIIKQ